MYLDLNYRVYLLRRLFFRRASQNVVAPGKRPDAPARLLLCAHYDAAGPERPSIPSESRAAPRLAARLPFPIGPFRILFWSLAALLPIIGVRMAGFDSTLISLLQLPPTLVLMIGAFLLTDIELSEVVPGANDNASGVATVLSLAEELDAQPPANLDVWVLLTGGEECLQEGMRSFLRAHRAELDRETTYFVNVDTVGHGAVRFEAAAGWVDHLPARPAPAGALRGDRHRRPRGLGPLPGASPWSTGSPATPCRPESRASGQRRSPA